MNSTQKKSVFIAIVGRPNAGKSSIMNRILGHKVAIVSQRPQTTRTKIMGVLTQDNVQYVFIDTPGIHRPRNLLGERMVKAVGDGISGVDVCIMTVDATMEPSHAEEELIKRFKAVKTPAVLAINKIDLIKNKEELLKIILQYTKMYDFAAIVPVSAKDGNGCDELLAELPAFAGSEEYYFDEDTLTDQPERVMAAEMIREKLLRMLDKEIPHGIAVEIEKFSDREDSDILDIEATIFCEKESHKGIIIGKGGAMLKKASTLAREDMEVFFDCRVNLKCWVKVREDWRNRGGIIHNFGLD